MDEWGAGDSLDGLPEGDSEALVRSLLRGEGVKVPVTLDDISELKRRAIDRKIKVNGRPKSRWRKHGHGRLGVGRVSGDNGEGLNLDKGGQYAPSAEFQLNETVEICVEIPAYLLAGMEICAGREGIDGFVRNAVRDRLISMGETWWYPRFLMSSEADRIAAKDKFTRNVG